FGIVVLSIGIIEEFCLQFQRLFHPTKMPEHFCRRPSGDANLDVSRRSFAELDITFKEFESLGIVAQVEIRPACVVVKRTKPTACLRILRRFSKTDSFKVP